MPNDEFFQQQCQLPHATRRPYDGIPHCDAAVKADNNAVHKAQPVASNNARPQPTQLKRRSMMRNIARHSMMHKRIERDA